MRHRGPSAALEGLELSKAPDHSFDLFGGWAIFGMSGIEQNIGRGLESGIGSNTFESLDDFLKGRNPIRGYNDTMIVDRIFKTHAGLT
jgi:hypothetical protein